MVLEKDQKLQNKVIVSDANHEVESEGSGELEKIGQEEAGRFNGNAEKKALFKASNKKKMQLTFEHIVIKAIPKAKRCGGAN